MGCRIVTQWRRSAGGAPNGRRGIVIVLSAAAMVVIVGFIAFSVDLGMIALTKARMQNAVDAASLAASQEIAAAVQESGESGGSGDVNSIAEANARQTAYDVALSNGVTINPSTDVEFGKRYYDEGSQTWPIVWGEGPYNVVKVVANRNDTAPEGPLNLSFGWVFGKPTTDLSTSAAAFIEARDIVLVLDYSASMSDDSEFVSASTIGMANLTTNQQAIYNALAPNLGTMTFTPNWVTVSGQPASGTIPHIDVTFKGTSVYVVSTRSLSNVVLQFAGGSKQTFSSLSGMTGTFSGTGSNSGKQINIAWVKSGTNSSPDGTNYGERFEDNYTSIKKAYGINTIAYPYSSGSWNEYIDYVKTNSDVNAVGFRKKYGGQTFVNYLMSEHPQFSHCNKLWKGPVYPFHAMKEGVSLFCDFLTDLGFGDRLGYVSYDSSARVETLQDIAGEPYVNLGDEPITYEFSDIDTIQKHRQPGHYDLYTGIGYGLKEGRELIDDKLRFGARPIILLMTDGLANRYPSGWSLPSGFSWAAYTDYDGDGVADFSTTDKAKQYAFYEATQAIQAGATVHTLSVGAGADDNLMRAIAFAGSGIWIDVPGGTSVAQMEAALLDAFLQIAGRVPPPKLVNGDE